MNRWTASRIPRYYLPTFFAAWTHSTVSTPDYRRESSMEPWLDRIPARSSLRVPSSSCSMAHLVRGFSYGYPRNHYPIGYSRPMFCRTIAPAKKTAVSGGRFDALAFRVLDGVTRKVLSARGCKIRICRRTSRCVFRGLSWRVALRVHVTPVQQCLNNLDLQQEGLQAEPGSRRIA